MPRTSRFLYGLLFVLAVILLLGAGCSNQPTNKTNNNAASSQPVNNDLAVEIKNFNFSPGVLTIKAGSTVVWSNQDSAVHTITSDSFQSPTISQGQTFEHRFDQAGTINYYCGVHPAMKGRIIVE